MYFEVITRKKVMLMYIHDLEIELESLSFDFFYFLSKEIQNLTKKRSSLVYLEAMNTSESFFVHGVYYT